MRRSTKILGVIAVVMIGLGGYGVYHASGLGGRDIVDGTVVELKEHIGEEADLRSQRPEVPPLPHAERHRALRLRH